MQTNGASDSKASATAEEILAQMAETYRTAKTYQDAGIGHVKFRQNGQKLEEKFDFSVAFERPNRLKLDAYGAVLRNDGKKVHGAIKDNPELTGVVLELDAPEKLTVENAVMDLEMRQAVVRLPAGGPPQVVLLLDEKALLQIPGTDKPVLLPSQDFEGTPCYRVRLDAENGTMVLWVDQKTHLLRRIDYPTRDLKEYLEADDAGAVENLELYVEFNGAKVNEPIPEVAFQFETPADAKVVKRLVGNPPFPVSPLLGKAVPEFGFTAMDGSKVTPETLKGKVAILDFWFRQCEAPCRVSFPLLKKIHDQYKDSDKVTFLAVNADDASLSNQTVLDTQKAWGSDIPAARDTDQHLRNKLEIVMLPTLLVLGPDGVVQHIVMGGDPAMETELPAVIEQLLRGESTFEATIKKQNEKIANYERMLQTPPDPVIAEGQTIPIPKTEIAPRSEPTSHRLTKLWSAPEMKNPANVFVIPAADANAAPKILVIEDPAEAKSIVELSTEGNVVARHDLALPPDAPISTLRTAVDGQGKRYYVTFMPAQQQLFVFDENWKQVLEFPAADSGTHAGIGDVRIADFNGDGVLELAVSYWGDVGIQQVSLDGKRNWSDRSLQAVLRIADGLPNADKQRTLYCASNRGTISSFDPAGKAGTEIVVPGRALITVYGATSPNGEKFHLSGLWDRSFGASTLVGFEPSGKELWSFDLPVGISQTLVETVSSAHVIGDDVQWLIAGADGSVSILGSDGKLIDKFNSGAALNGLTGAKIGDQSILYISTAEGLSAWKLEPAAAQR